MLERSSSLFFSSTSCSILISLYFIFETRLSTHFFQYDYYIRCHFLLLVSQLLNRICHCIIYSTSDKLVLRKGEWCLSHLPGNGCFISHYCSHKGSKQALVRLYKESKHDGLSLDLNVLSDKYQSRWAIDTQHLLPSRMHFLQLAFHVLSRTASRTHSWCKLHVSLSLQPVWICRRRELVAPFWI